MAVIIEIPTELLIEIFSFCAAVEPLAPLTLQLVCHLWRDIVQSSPSVWQRVEMHDTKRSISDSHAQAKTWLSLSNPLPFEVSVDVQSPDTILPLLSPFLSDVGRWTSLEITGETEESFLFSDSSLNLQSLDHLYLAVADEPAEKSSESSIFTPFSPLHPDKLAMSLRLSQMPATGSLMPLRFTTVSIEEKDGIQHIQPTEILHFLTACPALQSFDFQGYGIHDDDHDTSSASVVRLPELVSLAIRCTCTVRALLSFIGCPNLEQLYLGHLNVDWSLPRSFDEDGDSDDEAHDPSRSPFSDQATGMGLRKLVKSARKLKRIEMDFADARTKDFAYIFDHLEHLEDFSIVASDMSDTVIRLLQPDEHSRVRLPKLRSLELINCPRISGDVVVQVLSERVKITDRLTPNDTLQEVAIVECDLFGQEHGHTLRQVLDGGRLQTPM
ncbi:hypothetical protein C8J56DRAFT_847016 [Mycena floridula]|nr:hypothetical protein C8J56DRAFT_847016 [Mycena floridula]